MVYNGAMVPGTWYIVNSILLSIRAAASSARPLPGSVSLGELLTVVDNSKKYDQIIRSDGDGLQDCQRRMFGAARMVQAVQAAYAAFRRRVDGVEKDMSMD